MMLNRSHIALAIKGLVSIGILAALLRFVDPAELWAAVRAMDVGLLALAVLMFYPAQILASYRWYYLLRDVGFRPSFWQIVRYTMLGQFSALFLPGQASGDVVRAIAISRGQVEKVALTLTVVVDKVSLLLAICLIGLLSGLWSPVLVAAPAFLPVATLVTLASAAAFLGLCRYRDPRLTAWLADALRRLLRGRAERLAELSSTLRAPRISWPAVSSIVLLSLALQLLNSVGGMVLARAMHLDIGLVDWLGIIAATSLIQVVPISIGGLGVREGGFVAILALYGISASQALSYSLTSFAAVAVLITLGWLAAEAIPVLRRLVASSHA